MGNKVAIITIGTELVQGLSPDTNSYYLSKKLFENDFAVHTHISVSDKEEDIVRAIDIAKLEHSIIITTGGLGPTADDLTREAVAKAYNVELCVDKELHALARVKHNAENAIKISSYPKGSMVIKPAVGTAGGFIFAMNNNAHIALPGVPSELEVLFEAEVLPFLNKHYKQKIYKKRRVYKIYDLNEVQIEKKLIDINGDFNYGLLPKLGEVYLYITVAGKSRVIASNELSRIDKKMHQLLSKNIFTVGEETLEHSIVEELKRRKLTISVAESSTGGLLGSRLASIDGASSVLLGGYITYAYSVKEKLGVPRDMLLENGAVSEPVAESMAVNVQNKIGSDIGVSITGIAGPKGETKEKTIGLHYIGIKKEKDEPIVKKYIFKGDREQVRRQASQKALLLIKEVLK